MLLTKKKSKPEWIGVDTIMGKAQETALCLLKKLDAADKAITKATKPPTEAVKRLDAETVKLYCKLKHISPPSKQDKEFSDKERTAVDKCKTTKTEEIELKPKCKPAADVKLLLKAKGFADVWFKEMQRWQLNPLSRGKSPMALRLVKAWSTELGKYATGVEKKVSSVVTFVLGTKASYCP